MKNDQGTNDYQSKVSGLSPEEYTRYGRHLVMPEVGLDGQKRLKFSKVLVIGAGGLGSPCSLYLAAAGVGTIGIADYDVIDKTNLHRQILYTDQDVGRSKVLTAAARLASLNPNVKIRPYEEKLSSKNAMEIFHDYDVIIDGTDNFPARYLTNDACVILGKPNVYASIFRFEGQASVFYPKMGGPCYRCLYPTPPPPGMVPSCAEGGVFGVLPGLVGLIQATEAIKLILGIGESLVGHLLFYDALTMTFEQLQLKKNPRCSVCGVDPEIRELIDYDNFCGVVEPRSDTVLPLQLHTELKQGRKVVLLDVREPHEFELVHIQGSKLIPLGQLPGRLNELNSIDDIVVYCHTGLRSERASQFLRENGYSRVRNLVGGIEEWALSVDQNLPRY